MIHDQKVIRNALIIIAIASVITMVCSIKDAFADTPFEKCDNGLDPVYNSEGELVGHIGIGEKCETNEPAFTAAVAFTAVAVWFTLDQTGALGVLTFDEATPPPAHPDHPLRQRHG